MKIRPSTKLFADLKGIHPQAMRWPEQGVRFSRQAFRVSPQLKHVLQAARNRPKTERVGRSGMLVRNG